MSQLPPPVILYVPPRGQLPECYLSICHIVSVYPAGNAAFIELTTGRTLQLDYNTNGDAHLAAWSFQAAMSRPLTDAEKHANPSPVGGAILKRS